MTGEKIREPACLVLPTYNEAENIERFVAAVTEVLPESARILIVDDNSPDGTGRIADRLAEDVANRASSIGPERKGSAPPTSPASTARSTRGPSSCSRWTPTFPTTPPTCRRCWRRPTR